MPLPHRPSPSKPFAPNRVMQASKIARSGFDFKLRGFSPPTLPACSSERVGDAPGRVRSGGVGRLRSAVAGTILLLALLPFPAADRGLPRSVGPSLHPGLPYPSGAARPDPGCAVALAPPTLEPGGVGLLTLRCEATPLRVRARLQGAPLVLFPVRTPPVAADRGALPGIDGDGPAIRDPAGEAAFAALLGIDVASAPGAHELAWEADFGGAVSASGRSTVRVEPRDFAVQRLTVAPRFVEPDAASLVRIQAERQRMAEVLGASAKERLWREAFAVPIPGASTGGFGVRRILNGQPRDPHTGLDLRAAQGERVLSSNAGVAVLVDTLYYAGRTVVLDHGLGLFTIYSHLSEAAVAEGELVERGWRIGRVGASGRVTGPHLHWAARLNGARVDPLSLVTATERLDAEEPAARAASRGRTELPGEGALRE